MAESTHQNASILPAVGSRIIPGSLADLVKALILVQSDGGMITDPDFEQQLGHALVGCGCEHVPQEIAPDTLATTAGVDADIQQMGFINHIGHDSVGHQHIAMADTPEPVVVLETIKKHRFAPGMGITLAFYIKYSRNIVWRQRPNQQIGVEDFLVGFRTGH
jgi:hypothetical protein